MTFVENLARALCLQLIVKLKIGMLYEFRVKANSF